MKQHILIVDDEPQIRELLALFLEKRGFRASMAGGAEEALKITAASPVDLTVLDINLRDEDGLQILSQLKAAHPQMLVVMLTGMGFVTDLLQEALQKGADGYVSKHLPMDELLLAIQNTLLRED